MGQKFSMLSPIIKKITNSLQTARSVFEVVIFQIRLRAQIFVLKVKLLVLENNFKKQLKTEEVLQDLKIFFSDFFKSSYGLIRKLGQLFFKKLPQKLNQLLVNFKNKLNKLPSFFSDFFSDNPLKIVLSKFGLRSKQIRVKKIEDQKSALIYSTRKEKLKSFFNLSWFKKFISKLKAGKNKFYTQVKLKSPPVFSKVYHRAVGRNYSILISLLVTVLILSSAWFVYGLVFRDLPSALDLTQKEQIVTTRILDRNGRLLYRIYKDENRTLVPLEQIPQNMIDATIAIEDKSFYEHHGFSLQGIFRALVKNIKTDTLQGGSTITQQLVKNRLLNNQRTIRRKLREVLLAVLVESTYSKDEILQMYLNEVSYGGSTHGVEEAAWRYFNKPAKDLTLGESAMLAGLPAAPSIYTPFGSNPELSKRRQKEVLRRMVEEGFISIEEAYHAEQEQLALRKDVIDIKAPHFVMYVKKLLAERYGEKMVQQGGLEVRTTLDLSLQTKAQEIVTQEVNKLAELNVNNGAALVTNPQTGEILAMVGSRNYFDFASEGQVNVTLRPRQPGSSIKPLTYSLALEMGKKPWSKLEDSPITYHIPGNEPYSPKNYDDKFHGTVTVRQALANSYNVPAVKTLAGLGVDKLIDHGQEMGISTWTDRSRFGLSLTLGAGEVLMTDLSQVYGTFANDGYTVELDPFIEIKDYSGEVLYRNACFLDSEKCRLNQTVNPLTAYRITDILADNQARVQAFGRYSVLEIPGHEVAVKTGTSNNLKDNWTMGYIENRLVGTWVGNNDNTQMSEVASGVTGASPIWSQLMQLMLDENNPHQFKLPEGYVEVEFCPAAQTLTCEACPRTTTEIFKKGEEPTAACNSQYFKNKDEEEAAPPPEAPPHREQIL